MSENIASTSWNHPETPEAPEIRTMLIGFYDLTSYMKYCKGKDDLYILELMNGYFDLTGGIIQNAGGVLVKTIGDAGLAVFPEDLSDVGVRTFLKVKTEGDAWLASKGVPSKALVKIHYGSVACGMVGALNQKRFDVYGKNVNTTALLPSSGIAISPQAFRSLNSDTRKLFKKHTRPVTYIAQTETH